MPRDNAARSEDQSGGGKKKVCSLSATKNTVPTSSTRRLSEGEARLVLPGVSDPRRQKLRLINNDAAGISPTEDFLPKCNRKLLKDKVARGHARATIIGPDLWLHSATFSILHRRSNSCSGVVGFNASTTVGTHLGLCDIFIRFHFSDKCNRSAAKRPRGATV